MRFGFTIPTHNDGPPLRHDFDRIYRICETAEEVGFDFGMVGSHRFSPAARDPSAPLVLLSAIAARTSTLRLATSVLLLPLYHPLDVAEQIATLDGISAGRVIVGLGIGYRRYEYEALGLPWRSRGSLLEEGIEILRQAWGDRPVTFVGRHFRIDGVEVVPKPAQRPGPPIWIGAQARRAIARAATHGDGWIAGYLESLSVLHGRVDAYRSAAGAAGRPSILCLMRKTGIRSKRREVEEVWWPEVLALLRNYRDAGARWPGDTEFWAQVDREPGRLGQAAADRMVTGNPEDCVEGVRRFQASTGCEYFLPSFGTAGRTAADDEQLVADLTLFGREVIPEFR